MLTLLWLYFRIRVTEKNYNQIVLLSFVKPVMLFTHKNNEKIDEFKEVFDTVANEFVNDSSVFIGEICCEKIPEFCSEQIVQHKIPLIAEMIRNITQIVDVKFKTSLIIPIIKKTIKKFDNDTKIIVKRPKTKLLSRVQDSGSNLNTENITQLKIEAKIHIDSLIESRRISDMKILHRKQMMALYIFVIFLILCGLAYDIIRIKPYIIKHD